MARPKKDLEDVKKRLVASQLKPVKLRVAASVLLHELTRRSRFAVRGDHYIRDLNEAAAEMARIVDVYYLNDQRRLVRIETDEITAGEFIDGGNLLRLPSGTVYKSLTVLRLQAIEAMEAIRESRRAVDAAALERELAREAEPARTPQSAPEDDSTH